MYLGEILFQVTDLFAAIMDSYCTGKGYGQSRQNTSFSMSRSMRSIAQHELGDRTSRCSAVELDGKLRNTQRRRVPLAVCVFRWLGSSDSNKLHSVLGAERERSSAVAMLVMVKAARIAGVRAIPTVSSCE